MFSKVGWGLGRCNFSCIHCYNDSSNSFSDYQFSDLKCVADKVCPFIGDINFGTGEFVVNKNSERLAFYIKSNFPGIDLAVTSNGYSIVKMSALKVKELFNDVDISIDFPDEETHRNFRNHKFAWRWAIDSLEILSSMNIPRTIVTCVTSLTTNKDIEKLLSLSKKYNARWRISWFRCAGRGAKWLKISAKRAWGIISFLSDKVVFECLDSIFCSPLGIVSEKCPAGWKSMRIHDNFETSCYPFLKGEYFNGGNLLDKNVTLQSIYHSQNFQKVRNRKVPFCEGCSFELNCRSGCLSRSFLHSNGLNQPDDYCPYFGNVNFDEIEKIKIIYKNASSLIHSGYLCTTICCPK